jgi:hypothetical protein
MIKVDLKKLEEYNNFRKDYKDAMIELDYIESNKGHIFKSKVFNNEKVIAYGYALVEVGEDSLKSFNDCYKQSILSALNNLGYDKVAEKQKASVRKTKGGLEVAPRSLQGAKTIAIILKKNKLKKSLQTLAKELCYKSVEQMCKEMPVDSVLAYK